MGLVTILFIITTAWYVFHFIVAYNAKEVNQEKALRKIGYGKTMGLFTMIVAISGQMIGFYSMFHACEERIRQGLEVTPAMIYGAIKVTMIVTIYGVLIYLFSLLLWFVASTLIEKKQAKKISV